MKLDWFVLDFTGVTNSIHAGQSALWWPAGNTAFVFCQEVQHLVWVLANLQGQEEVRTSWL